MKRIIFTALMLAIVAVFLAALGAIAVPRIAARLQPQLLAYMASRITPAERDSIYREMGLGGSFWEAVPDADVGEIGQSNRRVRDTGVDVRLNNAGMRSTQWYLPKKPGTFRIVCLGDSFVFGMGGPEEDRFCDQLGEFYRRHSVLVNGQTVETYAVGLPGWTTVQEATYLTSRLSSYDADLIIVLVVANDITDNFGVNGVGALTAAFSPETRSLGSAVYSDDINRLFGDFGPRAALAWDFSAASRARWTKALERLKQLAEVQQARGKEILISVMSWGRTDPPDEFAARFQSKYRRAGVRAPMIIASFLPGTRTMLGHDSHPNRLGHQLLRDEYLHALHQLRWIPLPDSVLPPLDRGTPVRVNPAMDTTAYVGFRKDALSVLRDDIDFRRLRPEISRGFLGGVIPDSRDPAHAVEQAPWGSLQTAFLLRRPAGGLKRVEVEVEIPPFLELFPFTLHLSLDGIRVADLKLDRPAATGLQRISGAPAGPPFDDQVVEVTLETSSYFSTIDDPRMKSYRLLRARAF